MPNGWKRSSVLCQTDFGVNSILRAHKNRRDNLGTLRIMPGLEDSWAVAHRCGATCCQALWQIHKLLSPHDCPGMWVLLPSIPSHRRAPGGSGRPGHLLTKTRCRWEHTASQRCCELPQITKLGSKRAMFEHRSSDSKSTCSTLHHTAPGRFTQCFIHTAKDPPVSGFLTSKSRENQDSQ